MIELIPLAIGVGQSRYNGEKKLFDWQNPLCFNEEFKTFARHAMPVV